MIWVSMGLALAAEPVASWSALERELEQLVDRSTPPLVVGAAPRLVHGLAAIRDDQLSLGLILVGADALDVGAVEATLAAAGATCGARVTLEGSVWTVEAVGACPPAEAVGAWEPLGRDLERIVDRVGPPLVVSGTGRVRYGLAALGAERPSLGLIAVEREALAADIVETTLSSSGASCGALVAWEEQAWRVEAVGPCTPPPTYRPPRRPSRAALYQAGAIGTGLGVLGAVAFMEIPIAMDARQDDAPHECGHHGCGYHRAVGYMLFGAPAAALGATIAHGVAGRNDPGGWGVFGADVALMASGVAVLASGADGAGVVGGAVFAFGPMAVGPLAARAR